MRKIWLSEDEESVILVGRKSVRNLKEARGLWVSSISVLNIRFTSG